MWFEEFYLNEELNATKEVYHRNGQLEFKQTWKNGNLDGPFESYFSNGSLDKKYNYKNGRIHGSYESYSFNGHLEEKSNYIYNLKEGAFLRWDGSNPLRTMTYKNDKLIGCSSKTSFDDIGTINGFNNLLCKDLSF